MILAQRDRAIANFKPTKHFTATLITEPGFEAQWNTRPFVTEEAPYVMERSLAEKADGASSITVDSYEQKKVARKPPAPFTTSVMQQAASAKLSMSAKDSMAAAQKLFENGLITYHRTDSTFLEPDSIKAIREVLKAKGLPIPETPPIHRSKAGAQEAHDAIRPTDPSNDNPTGSLGSNERRLYALIHKQTLASQMANKIERVTTIKAYADIDGQRFEYQAKATEVLEKGYTALLGQGKDDEPAVTLPKIEKGEAIAITEGKVVDK
ncbi:MAG: DNA topoisomerase [Guyparkeria sp.]